MLNQKVRKTQFLHFLELTTTLHSIVKSVLEEFKLSTANYNYRGCEEDTILKPTANTQLTAHSFYSYSKDYNAERVQSTAHTTVSRSACICYIFFNIHIHIHCTIHTHTKISEKGRSTCLPFTWPCWAKCNWIF